MRSFIYVSALVFICSCSQNRQDQMNFSILKEELAGQLKYLAGEIPGDKVPRSYPHTDGGIRMVGINDWTSGFPAGSFWLMYELTNDEYWIKTAIENTVKLNGIQYQTNTHDLGFMVYCSYGNAYRLTGNDEYKKVVVEASESLISRYNPAIGCIRSWDFGKWQFPVIIDNMMNLEMLFRASEFTGDAKFKDVAVSHADITLENHYRDNWSSYHVVDFDTLTGEPIQKQTHQGLNDDSSWARGQAWGFYGFTMCYRETGDERYLNAAENIGQFILENLPDDKVPYWDFNVSDVTDAPRDASAAAITASALYELSTFSQNKSTWLTAANEIMESLTSEKYRTADGSNGGFILKHSVGHLPGSSEIDVALNYTDYYYLEALKRKQELTK
jgi:unsaturated chondroitin disaccharide hydrolase